MAIRQTKYVDITSGVGGKSAVADRELIARCMTKSAKVGYGHILEFNDASAVSEYFGSGSSEYTFAAKYFGFVSKSVTKAKKISFARWCDSVTAGYIATSPLVTPNGTIANYKTTNGKLKIVIDTHECEISDIALSSVTSLTDVASAIQTAVRAYSEGSPATTPFTGATCTYENNRFTLTFPTSVTGEIKACKAYEITSENQTDLATLIGFNTGNEPVLSNTCNIAHESADGGSTTYSGETPVEAITRVDAINDNFGSFMYLDMISDADAKAVAQWNQTKNYKYLFVISRNADTILDAATELKGFVGTHLVRCWTNTDYAEFMSMAIFASTDYSRANSTKCFMYQMFDTEEATVTTDSMANSYDAKYINYLGVTQSAGQLIQFYQDGFNMDGVDTGVYCNEVWMKAKFWTNIMNLFLAVEKVPANNTGKSMIKTVMMDTIGKALVNGTICVEKEFTITQKVYINTIFAMEDAWKEVYASGYKLDITIETDGSRYTAKYVFCYSKGDAIRKVEGSDILI